MVDDLLLVLTGLGFGVVGIASSLLIDKDGRVTRFAQTANLARILIMGTLFCGLLGFLAGLSAYGLVLELRDSGSDASKLVLLAGAFLLFGGILAPTVRGGVNGLRARFGIVR